VSAKFRLRVVAVLIVLISLCALIATLSPATAFAEEGRKVKVRVPPVFPEVARRANITGTVKVQAVVAPGGDVRSTKVVGGHPMLAAAAEDAIKKWKYEPASETSTLVIEVEFKHGF
jgi:TonB family protein